jgi:hypothetical protein
MPDFNGKPGPCECVRETLVDYLTTLREKLLGTQLLLLGGVLNSLGIEFDVLGEQGSTFFGEKRHYTTIFRLKNKVPNGLRLDFYFNGHDFIDFGIWSEDLQNMFEKGGTMEDADATGKDEPETTPAGPAEIW